MGTWATAPEYTTTQYLCTQGGVCVCEGKHKQHHKELSLTKEQFWNVFIWTQFQKNQKKDKLRKKESKLERTEVKKKGEKKKKRQEEGNQKRKKKSKTMPTQEPSGLNSSESTQVSKEEVHKMKGKHKLKVL